MTPLRALLPPALDVEGAPIAVRFLLAPRAVRGQLVSGGTRGREVHAGAFLRQRVIVLDAALRDDPAELRRILVHELHHFAWVRLGNPLRRSWLGLLAAERCRGELGWSAMWRKQALRPEDRLQQTAHWRDYACEAFCDTGAWMHADGATHDEWTLSQSCRALRQQWWQALPQPLRV